MSQDDPFAVLNAIPRELSDTRAAVENLRTEVQKDRRKIKWLRRAFAVIAVAALVSIGWTAYQQAVLDSKSAAITRLTDQNADRGAAQARNAHNLCVKLNRTRSEILPVWEKVLSSRPDGRVLLARIKAAIPLGACPKA